MGHATARRHRARTGVLHPASSTHAQLTPKQQLAAGITPDLIYENLPNVPVQDAALLSRERLSSSHVPPRKEQIPAFAQQHLLSLHYLAIRQARKYLKPGGARYRHLAAESP